MTHPLSKMRSIMETILVVVDFHTPLKRDDAPNYEHLEQALEIVYDRSKGRKADGNQGYDEETVLYTEGDRNSCREDVIVADQVLTEAQVADVAMVKTSTVVVFTVIIKTTK
ncbi:hypothetical protein PHMEG_00033395 [Phytophthora megakarya]|uniref:Uncharacterized protein n=1 Tax=Phytophthora megakarya TaxID=4795 RepID=A0A225UT37_9STRA|nr:hypothetical protein PHMEG_00033395 [Phytophthora megakarya]